MLFRTVTPNGPGICSGQICEASNQFQTKIRKHCYRQQRSLQAKVGQTFHVIVMQGTAKICSNIYNTRVYRSHCFLR